MSCASVTEADDVMYVHALKMWFMPRNSMAGLSLVACAHGQAVAADWMERPSALHLWNRIRLCPGCVSLAIRTFNKIFAPFSKD